MLQISAGIQNPKKSPRHLNFLKQLKNTTEMNNNERFSFSEQKVKTNRDTNTHKSWKKIKTYQNYFL